MAGAVSMLRALALLAIVGAGVARSRVEVEIEVSASGDADADELPDVPWNRVVLLQTSCLKNLSRRFAPGEAGDHVDQALSLMRLLDANSDGKLARDEIETFAASHGLDAQTVAGEFSSLDSNGDGSLEAQELQSLLQAAATPPPPEAPVSEPAEQLESPTPAVFNAPSAEPIDVIPDIEANAAAVMVDAEPGVPTPTARSRVDNVQSMPSASASLSAAPPVEAAERAAAAFAAPAEPAAAAAIGAAAATKPIEPALAQAVPVEFGAVAPAAMTMKSDSKPVTPAASPGGVFSAQQVAEQLGRQEAEEAQVMGFQAAAATLRANATSILMRAELDARVAAEKVAQEHAQEMIKEMSDLEMQATEAETKASALRARAQAEARQAFAAVAAAAGAMKKLPV